MLTLEQSKSLLLENLKKEGLSNLIIFDEWTIEGPNYFVFSCNSKRFFESRDYSDLIIGGTAYILDRVNGKVLGVSTAEPIEYFIDLFEKGLL